MVKAEPAYTTRFMGAGLTTLGYRLLGTVEGFEFWEFRVLRLWGFGVGP